MTERAEPFLELEGVTKRFDNHVAVDVVDLEIGRGDFVTLLGPSGCGKTTLLRMIAGFEIPTDGRIRLEGEDIGRRPPERRPLNMVFQSYALFPHMNVFENVAYGLRTAGVARAEVTRRVSSTLELVNLDRFATKAVTELSGGMSQRVALARAIVNEPRVLLLDEPLAALDLQLRKRMQVELRALQQRLGTTFIYVTHDQEEALVMSHRVVLMNEGRIAQVGTPHEVYHRPSCRFSAGFIGETSLLGCTVEDDRDGVLHVRVPQGLRAIAAVAAGGERPGRGEEALISLRPEHLRVTDGPDPAFRGVLADTIFLGAKLHYLVDLADGTRLRAEGGELAGAEAGAQVGVEVVPGGGAVLRDI